MEFKATMFLPSTTISSGLLCPDQRRMPQIGSLFAEIFAMGILIVRLPLVVVVSSPVLMDLLTGPCYLNAMSHSLLMNCGQELFSLEAFFESAYACNKYFWGIFAVIGNFLPAGFAQTFLNGMAAVGENSGASAFMPGIIGAFSKITANDPSEGATNAQNLVTGSVSRFGPTAMFMKTALNPIAGAHWIWRVASRMTVQIMQATKAQRSIGSVFWNVLYDGRVDYENLVAKRMFNTCGGLALMAGYTSPLGNVILHYCFAGVKSTIATLNLLSVFFVDLPIIVCVCRQTSGNNPADWILHNCDSPDGLKPLLRTIMDNPHMCAEFVNRTNTNLTTVFDDTLGELFAGTNTVGSVLDSLLAAVDGSKAGQCDNFNSNPYVVTLIPEPADYWRVCGNTDFCRLRCKQQMEAFELVRPSSFLRSTTSTQTTQSLFFPAITADAYNQFSSTGVIALSELESCASICPAAEDRCFLLGGFASAAILRAVQYCVPSALAQGVGKSGQWDTMGISGQSVDIKFIRIGIEGGWQDTYAFVGMQDSLVQICGKLDCKEFPAVDVGVLGFQQMQVLGDIAVFQVSTEEEGSTSWCLSFAGSEWSFYPCPSTNVWDQGLYHIVTTASSKAILLPYDNVPLQICQLQSAILSNCVQYVGFDRQNVPVKTRGIQSRVSQFVSTEYSIFVATNEASHWLTMLFVTISGPFASGMIGNSMPVTIQYTLQQSCSLDSCTGCVQLSVQRLCFAAQQCQVARCVGSQVNQLRPLCAIGGIVEAQFFALLAGLHGVWSMISSTLVFIIDAAGGINPPKNVAWPDQAFYGLVCSLKDSYASMVSVFTSAINGVVQSSMPSTMLAHGETVDNRFLATFTLTMTAVTNFLYQLTLGPLYAAIAMQKIMVCQTNSLIAAISDNNAVTIGDPAIQTASGVAAGVCMSQMHTENAQASNSGVDTNKAFVSGSIQVLSRLGGLALQLPLDQLIHPIDVMFTYMLGVTMGLQDVLETADQKK